MKVYKLTESDMTANGGFQYTLGVKAMPARTNPDAPLCGPEWLHSYPSRGLAVFMSPIHVEYAAPRLFEAEASGHVKYDGGKLGSAELTLVREVSIPAVPNEARVEFAIRTAMMSIKDMCPEWSAWADAWLDGRRNDDAMWKAAGESIAKGASFFGAGAVWGVAWCAWEAAWRLQRGQVVRARHAAAESVARADDAFAQRLATLADEVLTKWEVAHA